MLVLWSALAYFHFIWYRTSEVTDSISSRATSCSGCLCWKFWLPATGFLWLPARLDVFSLWVSCVSQAFIDYASTDSFMGYSIIIEENIQWRGERKVQLVNVGAYCHLIFAIDSWNVVAFRIISLGEAQAWVPSLLNFMSFLFACEQVVPLFSLRNRKNFILFTEREPCYLICWIYFKNS